MKRNILTKLFCLAFVALLSFSAYAQEKIYLVKDSKVVAIYDLDEVDYLTFSPEGTIDTEDFEITIDDLGYYYVVWTVTPKDPDMYYYTNVYTEESLRDRYHNSVDDLASLLHSDMAAIAGWGGVSVDEFMETQVLYKGKAQTGYYQMRSGSDYVLVAFGCNPDGTATTKTYTTLDFSTPVAPQTGLTVDFNITAETNDATVEYIPSDNTIRYFIELREGVNDVDMQDWMNTLIWRGSVNGKTPEQVVEENSYFGVNIKEYSLEPETEYTVYACSVTEDGVVNSEVSTQTFVTGPVAMSDNTFELSVSNIGTLKANLTVKPSNKDFYSVGVLPASAFEGKTDQEVLEEYVAQNAFWTAWRAHTGEFTFEDWTGLNPETEYIFFAFGYYHSTITTPMTKTSFTTLPPTDPKTWVPTFGEIVKGDYYGWPAASVQISVNQDDVRYLWNVCNENGTAEQIYEKLISECDRCEALGFNYVEAYGVRGPNEVTYAPDPNGDNPERMKFFAVVMNPETRELETEIFFSEVFTMKDEPAEMPAFKVAKPQVGDSVEKDAKANEKLVVKNILKL